MGHRDTLLCDTTYLNATTARSTPRASVRRSQSGFVQVGFWASSPGQRVRRVELSQNAVWSTNHLCQPVFSRAWESRTSEHDSRGGLDRRHTWTR